LIAPYRGDVAIDIGTGDGGFVCQSARQHPEKFYIGIDANPSALTKISEKIHRKPAKGGLANALFVHASAEALPSELDRLANEVYVNFPWGSLLRAVVTGEEKVLDNLRRICAPQARLKIFFSLDPNRDGSEIRRLELPNLSREFLETVLKPRYATAGFAALQAGVFAGYEWPQLRTAWAKRLRNNDERFLICIEARPVDLQMP